MKETIYTDYVCDYCGYITIKKPKNHSICPMCNKKEKRSIKERK